MNNILLKILYKEDIKNMGKYISREEIINISGIKEEIIDRAVRSLEDLEHVDLNKGSGAYFHDIRISRKGRFFLNNKKQQKEKSRAPISKVKNDVEKPKVKRKKLSRAIVVAIFQKYEGLCAICGKKTEFDYGEIDHITPISKGGSQDNPDNLQWLCTRCNKLKGNKKTNYDVKKFIAK